MMKLFEEKYKNKQLLICYFVFICNGILALVHYVRKKELHS